MKKEDKIALLYVLLVFLFVAAVLYAASRLWMPLSWQQAAWVCYFTSFSVGFYFYCRIHGRRIMEYFLYQKPLSQNYKGRKEYWVASITGHWLSRLALAYLLLYYSSFHRFAIIAVVLWLAFWATRRLSKHYRLFKEW
jgi:hypothetical protein